MNTDRKGDSEDDKSEGVWIRIASVAAVLGLALYVVGYLFRGDRSPATLAQDLGQAVLISGAIAFLIDRRVHTAMRTIVDKAVSRFADATFVTHGAHALDIEGIFVRRGPMESQHYTAAVDAALTRAIERNGTINILCVAGPEFFKDGALYRLICEGLRRPGNAAEVHVLLLDPASETARERAKLEDGHTTLADIEAAVGTLCWLQKEAPNRVQYRYCVGAGSNFLVMTDDTLFHEAYPTAPVGRPNGPIGGFTALLQYSRRSRAYARWAAHFAHEWKQAEALSPET